MFVSVRTKFRRGDKYWRECIEPLGLPYLSEVRSIYSILNYYAAHYGPIDCTPETLDAALDDLPVPDPDNQYYLLVIDLLTESEFVARLPAGWKLLGHDLSDKTKTSSLHACGRWEGQLKPLAQRVNEFGLLSLADAELARKILPIEWGEQEPHAHVTIWALYERQ
jgi:hypothetical protein